MNEKKIILAVDDSLQQLIEFKSMLIPKYDLRVVKSAAEAASFLVKNSADVILLDIEMPNISGFEFLDDLKKIPGFLNTPVIIVSGNSGQDFINRAKDSNVYEILTKPVKPDVLVSLIDKAVSGTRPAE